MNQIDPGPGYRIVHYSEPPQEGIEMWCRDVGEWRLRSNQALPLCQQWTYRIKVEPVVKQSLTTEYIEPTDEHVGQMVEVSDGHLWYTGRLLGVLPDQYDSRYICQDEVESKEWNSWRHARIKPEPKPELRYRDVTPADIGKAIQVRDSDNDQWIDCSLLRIVWMTTHDAKGTQDHKTYVCNLGQTWAQARIVDGGEA